MTTYGTYKLYYINQLQWRSSSLELLSSQKIWKYISKSCDCIKQKKNHWLVAQFDIWIQCTCMQTTISNLYETLFVFIGGAQIF